jgi:hypothetical protein
MLAYIKGWAGPSRACYHVWAQGSVGKITDDAYIFSFVLIPVILI